MKYCFLFSLLLCTQFVFGQINSFPNSEGFENAFTSGNDVEFTSNWTGNEVSNSNRIFQGSDARSGSSSLNVIPTSTFSGEILISLDLTGINNPRILFYAFSKQNGTSSSDRPVLLNFSTSTDGGINYLDDVNIGDDTTFPNNNSTSFTDYEYELPISAAGESNVIVKITASRGAGSGSAAELILDDFTIEEQILPLAINSVSATNPNTLEVVFNQTVDQTSAETVSNYVINNAISVNSASRSANNTVSLSTSTFSNNNYQLTVNGVEDEASNTPVNNLQQSFNYIQELAIESIIVQDQNTLLVDFNLDLEQTSAETLTNYAVDNSIGGPSSATLGTIDKDQVTLIFPNNFDANTFTLSINNVTDESTLTTASDLTETFDYLPLTIDNVTVTSATTIELDFNQDLETTSAQSVANYNINFEHGNPTSVVQNVVNRSLVTLTIARALVNNTYEIAINNVRNASGNATALGLTSNAQYEATTYQRQIVINEIFADPSGSNDPDPLVLPREEFVELYNTTSEAIDISNFELSGGLVGNFVLNAESYVILTSTTDISNYQSLGDVVGVSSWNILSNGGEQLILRDNLGNQVDSLTYDLNWYQDENKEDGGWTLEQVNPELICSDENNWRASVNTDGGSPGTENSVYDSSPDIVGPSITAVRINSPSQVTITFDEIIDKTSVIATNFSLDNGVSINSASLNLPYGRSIMLNFTSPMTSGTIYELNISDVTDCAGNTIVGNTRSYLFDNEAPVFDRFIFKSSQQIDLLFDEGLEETTAEIEANFTLDQSIGNPNQATLNASDRNRISLAFNSNLTVDQSYVLSYQNLTDTLGNPVSFSNENFVFQDQLDTIIVISSQLLDIYFEEELNETSVEQIAHYVADDGLGSPLSASLDGLNPKLVHLVFDNSFPENSSTEIQFENIQDASLNYLQILNRNFTYDTDDPDVDSVVVLNENSIRIYFDEILDETSAEIINNYTVNNGHGSPSVVTLQPNRTSVILEFASNFEQEVKNRLTLTAIEDLSGNAITTNRNFEFTFDSLPPRLIDLDLINPTDLLVIFSEELVESVAEDVNNYAVDNGIGNPINAALSKENKSIVRLTFSDLGNHAVNTLSISNVVDLFSNNLVSNLQGTFSSQLPEFGTFTILSDTSIQLHFTKELTQNSAEEIENYGFDSGIGPFSLDQDDSDQSIVTVLLTTRLKEGQNYRLVVNDLEDLDGNILQPTTYDFNYTDYITQINIINANTLQIQFETPIDEVLAETPANFVLDNEIGNPLTAVLNSDDASILTLFFDDALTESESYELSIQNLTDIFNNIIPASRNTIDFDVTAPSVTSVTSSFENEIEVSFNEPVDRATATSLNHYTLNNGVGQPIAIELSTDAITATLTFSNSLIDATLYTLVVDRVEDLQGKAIVNQQVNFTFESPITPGFRDLVINEIYFDNELSAEIPNFEFIEIFNRGVSDIELRNFAITDKRDTAYLSTYLMVSGDHLTLSTNGGRFEFDDYGNAMGLSNFPSLANRGETILLLDRDFNIIDSLQYTTEFYNNEAKEDGGFTVELINPNKPCFDITNYAASTDADGGTPGNQNSVYDISADIIAPSILDLEVISSTELLLTFSEAMDISTLDIGNFSTSGPEDINEVTVNEVFGTSIFIRLAAPFPLGTEQILAINNLADCSGNVISTSSTYFLGAEPGVNDLIVSEIMASPGPSQGLPEREFIEIYNNSSQILSLSGLVIEDNNSSTQIGEYDLIPEEYLILTSTSGASEFIPYGNVLGVRSFPSLSADDIITITNADGLEIFSIDFDKSFYNDSDKADGGYSLEMINLNPGCYDHSNWAATNENDGGSPGTQNSVFDDTPDTTAPELLSVSVIDQGQLSLVFNESMDVSTLIPTNFSLNDGLNVSLIEIEDDFGTKVELYLNNSFERGQVQNLTISGVSDCSGNQIDPITSNFSLGDIPQIEEIIVTEIMASPAPSQGLPEREYFELYNNSNKILNMAELRILDGADERSLPPFNLNPQEYLIITTSAGVTDLGAYGNTIGVNSFPTLTIKDEIILINSADDIVFQVAYDRSFYKDESKDDGGFSIEMINLNPSCYDEANWIATSSSVGGTPGTQNSVFDDRPDTSAPTISSFTVISGTELEIIFSESMDVSSLIEANMDLSGTLSINEIRQIGSFGLSIRVVLDQAFTLGTLYTLTLTNITDCAGNSLISDPLEFARGATPSAGELIITEIMANPTPSQGLPEVEYIEVFNTSDQILDLNGLYLADATSSTVLGSMVLEPGEFALLAPSSTANALSPFGKVLPVTNWPTLNNSSDRSALFSPNSEEIHAVNYSDVWYDAQSKSQGGFSLEMIDKNYYCVEGNNWTGSASVSGGSPGSINSVDGSNPDLFGPTVLQAIAVTSSIVELTFNEKLNPASISIDNFSADNGLNFISAQIDETDRIVTLITSIDLVENTLYTLSLDNITDCTGNMLPATGRTVELIIAGVAEPLDIIVNEILFDPVTGGDRFVEFYNNSNKYINLKGWKIAGRTNTKVVSEENLFISPQSYFVITSDGSNIKETYPSADESVFTEINSMPSLPTDEGTIFIYNLTNAEIDRFEYSADYHSSLLDDPDGISLERLLFSGGSNDPNNWFTASEAEGGATPGYENSQSIQAQNQIGEIRVDPPTFAPDIPGASNFTTLNYSFDDPGNTLNIRVIDGEGRIIKQITQNTVVGSEGFFTWDGSTEEGGKASVGYYMIVMEIINTDGNISYRRQKVAIGSRF